MADGEISLGIGQALSHANQFIAKWEEGGARYHVWISETGDISSVLHKNMNDKHRELDFTANVWADKRRLIHYMIKQGQELNRIRKEEADRIAMAELERRSKAAARNRERALRFLRIIGNGPDVVGLIEKVEQADLETLEKWEEEGAF